MDDEFYTYTELRQKERIYDKIFLSEIFFSLIIFILLCFVLIAKTTEVSILGIFFVWIVRIDKQQLKLKIEVYNIFVEYF